MHATRVPAMPKHAAVARTSFNGSNKITFQMSINTACMQSRPPARTGADRMRSMTSIGSCSSLFMDLMRTTSGSFTAHDSSTQPPIFHSQASALDFCKAECEHSKALAEAGVGLDLSEHSAFGTFHPIDEVIARQMAMEEDSTMNREEEGDALSGSDSGYYSSSSPEPSDDDESYREDRNPRAVRRQVSCPPNEQISIDSGYTQLDVICQRGGLSNHHPGNHRYMQIRKQLQPAYLNGSRREKTQLAQQLVDSVHAYGGRFVRLDKKKGEWYELSNLDARTKASQTLRETLDAAGRAAKRRRYPRKRRAPAVRTGEEEQIA